MHQHIQPATRNQPAAHTSQTQSSVIVISTRRPQLDSVLTLLCDCPTVSNSIMCPMYVRMYAGMNRRPKASNWSHQTNSCCTSSLPQPCPTLLPLECAHHCFPPRRRPARHSSPDPAIPNRRPNRQPLPLRLTPRQPLQPQPARRQPPRRADPAVQVCALAILTKQRAGGGAARVAGGAERHGCSKCGSGGAVLFQLPQQRRWQAVAAGVGDGSGEMWEGAGERGLQRCRPRLAALPLAECGGQAGQLANVTCRKASSPHDTHTHTDRYVSPPTRRTRPLHSRVGLGQAGRTQRRGRGGVGGAAGRQLVRRQRLQEHRRFRRPTFGHSAFHHSGTAAALQLLRPCVGHGTTPRPLSSRRRVCISITTTPRTPTHTTTRKQSPLLHPSAATHRHDRHAPESHAAPATPAPACTPGTGRSV